MKISAFVNLLPSPRLRSLVLIILSLAFLWSIPGTIGAPTLGNFVPKNFEVNAMAVSPHGDVGVGSFYAMDPTVIPWNLNNSIYKYTVVTLIVSNSNVTDLSSTVGINVPSALPGILPFKVILIIQGVQINAPAIVSDIESVFGMPAGSFLTLTSNPVTLPVSVFGASISPVSQYSGFVNAFVKATSGKAAVIGKYSASLLESSSSAIFFNSIESLTYPVGPIFGASGASGLTTALFSTYFDDALGINSTGVVVLHKNYFDFSQAADHTLSFDSFLGVPSITSATNETFATILPDGANVTSFSPSSMLVESSANGANFGQGIPGVTAVVGLFPWLGSAQRLLPDVTVSFHYPAFDSPVLSASEVTTPTPFNPGQNFTLALSVGNQGLKDARDLHFTLDFAGVVSWNQTSLYNSNQITYSVTSLAVGKTDTRNFRFLSLAPEAPFVLSAAYLDSASYAYSWRTIFSLAPNVNIDGPVVVTKSLNVTSPSYGQIGQVTTTIHNTSPTQTFYNVLDTTPEALPLNYPNGLGTSTNQPCPYINNFQANTTHFTFQVSGGCSSTLLTQVLVKHGTQTTPQIVDTPNLPLWGGDVWAPLRPYTYPGGITLNFGENVTLQLNFQNAKPQTSFWYAAYPGTIYTYFQEDPRTSYLSLACSPCQVVKGGTTTISGNLTDATGTPIAGATVELEYRPPSFGPGPGQNSFLANVTTNAQGQYIFPWTAVSQLNVGYTYLTAFYPGSVLYNSKFVSANLYVVNPTTINPGQTITLNSLYFFNVTGPLTIEPDRVIYSSKANISYSSTSGTTILPLLGEYVALSNNVTLTVGPPSILPVVDITMNTTKFDFYYVAQNQTDVQINIRVNNAGPQTATNVVVTALIPRPSYSNYYGPARWLPIVDAGTITSVDNYQGAVSFSVATLQPGQAASAWYVVKMNTTGLFTTYSNVTAQGPTGTHYEFTYTGSLLAGYPTFTKSIPQPGQGSLQTYVTIAPSAVANGTSTSVTLHLYNTLNATYSNINATVSSYNYNGAQLTFDRKFALVSDMAPFTSQTVTFTATDHSNYAYPWTSQSIPISGSVSYNQSSTVGYNSGFYSNLLVYNALIPMFNPGISVDVSVQQTSVTAGAGDLAVVTVANTGSTNVTDVHLSLQEFWPETYYGFVSNSWGGIIRPGESVKFRVGIQTRPGVLYPVIVSNIDYQYYLP